MTDFQDGPDDQRHEFALAAVDEGTRADRLLADRLSFLSRTRLQALIADGFVLLDGHPMRSPKTRCPGQGRVVVTVPPARPAEPVGQAIPLDVVFEDEHLLVLDKPAGLVVHPAAGHDDGTLVNALIAHCGDSLSGIGGVRRPGIVHRLDKDTTGLMVVAKTDAAHQGLAALFADHGRTGSLDRRYKAVVWGTPAAAKGTVDKPLGRHPHHRDRIAIMSGGRHAVTHWQVLEDLGGATLVECRLETGRTHQIRVHLTAIGHPLLGDPVYGLGFRTKAMRLSASAGAAVQGLGRQALHAARLGFEHPITGETMAFSSPLPPDLADVVAVLRDAPAAEPINPRRRGP